MIRALAILALLVSALPAPAARRVRVDEALCVAPTGAALTVLAPEARDAYLASLAAMGWRQLRTEVGADLAAADDLVTRAEAHGVGLLGVLSIRANDESGAYAARAAAGAGRFRGRVPAWELGEEPNLGMADPARYGRLALAAARAIRRADRRARITTGGLAPGIEFGSAWGFLRVAARAAPGLLQRAHAAAIHLDLGTTPDEEVFNDVRSLRARLREARAGGRGMWITRVHDASASAEERAQRLVRAASIGLSERAARWCWAADDPSDAERAAATTFARVLEGTHFVRDLRSELGIPASAYALCFGTPRLRTTVIVFWAQHDGVAVGAGIGDRVRGVRLVTLDGAETDLGLPARVELTLGTAPVYLVLQEGPA